MSASTPFYVAATLHVPPVTFDSELGKAALRHLGSPK